MSAGRPKKNIPLNLALKEAILKKTWEKYAPLDKESRNDIGLLWDFLVEPAIRHKKVSKIQHGTFVDNIRKRRGLSEELMTYILRELDIPAPTEIVVALSMAPCGTIPQPRMDLESYNELKTCMDSDLYEAAVKKVCDEMYDHLQDPDWKDNLLPDDQWLEMLKANGDYAELALRAETSEVIGCVFQSALKLEVFKKFLCGRYKEKEFRLLDVEDFKNNYAINLWVIGPAVLRKYRSLHNLEITLYLHYVSKMNQWMQAGTFSVQQSAMICLNEADEYHAKLFGMKKYGPGHRKGTFIYHCRGFLTSPGLYAPNFLQSRNAPVQFLSSDGWGNDAGSLFQPVGKAYTHHELLKKRSLKQISDDLDALDDAFTEELQFYSESYVVSNTEWHKAVKRDRLSCFYVCDIKDRIIGYIFQVSLTDDEMDLVIQGKYREDSFINKAAPISTVTSNAKNIYLVNIFVLEEYRNITPAFLRLKEKYETEMRKLAEKAKIREYAAVCASKEGVTMARLLLKMAPIIRRHDAPGDKNLWWVYRTDGASVFSVTTKRKNAPKMTD